MALKSKYTRQILSAAATIKRKGCIVQWAKAPNSDSTDDPSPEFPSNDEPTVYKVPAVFYPALRQNLYTVIPIAVTGQPSNQLFAIVPGNVKFTPEEGDSVTLPDGRTVLVDTINTTMPDGVPIIYDVSFK